MSYSLSTTCYNCKKKEVCKDQQKLEKAIFDIHQDFESHKGAGQVIVQCVRMDAEK